MQTQDLPIKRTLKDRYYRAEKMLEKQHASLRSILHRIYTTIVEAESPLAVAPMLRTLVEEMDRHLCSAAAMNAFSGKCEIVAHDRKYRDVAEKVTAFADQIEREYGRAGAELGIHSARRRLLGVLHQSLAAHGMPKVTDIRSQSLSLRDVALHEAAPWMRRNLCGKMHSSTSSIPEVTEPSAVG